jgi:hypothetical protein
MDKEKGLWDGETCPVQVHQLTETLRLREMFENRVIRRTKNSLDYDGEPLIRLPPCTQIALTVRVREWEREYIEASVDEETLERCAFIPFPC